MFPHGQQPRWGIGQQQNFRAGMMPRSNVSGADLMGQRLVQMGPQMGAQIQQVSVMRQQTITANTPSWGSPSVNVSQRMNIISQAQQIQTQQIQAQQIQQQQIQAQQIQTQQIQAQQIRVQQLRAQAQQIPNQQQVMVQQLNAMQNNQLQNQRMQQIQSHFQNMARSLSGQPGTLPVSSQQNNLYQVRNASVWRCPDDRDKKNRPPSTDSNRSHSSRKESGSSNRKSPSRNLSRSSSSRDRYGNSSERREYRRNSYENDGSDSACRKSDDSRDQRHRKKRRKFSERDDISDDEFPRKRSKRKRNEDSPGGKNKSDKDYKDFLFGSIHSDEESDYSTAEQEESQEKPVEDDTPAWVRCSPADLYFARDSETENLMATKKMTDLEDKFEHEIVKRGSRIRDSLPKADIEPRPSRQHRIHMHFEDDPCTKDVDSDLVFEKALEKGQILDGEDGEYVMIPWSPSFKIASKSPSVSGNDDLHDDVSDQRSDSRASAKSSEDKTSVSEQPASDAHIFTSHPNKSDFVLNGDGEHLNDNDEKDAAHPIESDSPLDVKGHEDNKNKGVCQVDEQNIDCENVKESVLVDETLKNNTHVCTSGIDEIDSEEKSLEDGAEDMTVSVNKIKEDIVKVTEDSSLMDRNNEKPPNKVKEKPLDDELNNNEDAYKTNDYQREVTGDVLLNTLNDKKCSSGVSMEDPTTSHLTRDDTLKDSSCTASNIGIISRDSEESGVKESDRCVSERQTSSELSPQSEVSTNTTELGGVVEEESFPSLKLCSSMHEQSFRDEKDSNCDILETRTTDIQPVGVKCSTDTHKEDVRIIVDADQNSTDNVEDFVTISNYHASQGDSELPENTNVTDRIIKSVTPPRECIEKQLPTTVDNAHDKNKLETQTNEANKKICPKNPKPLKGKFIMIKSENLKKYLSDKSRHKNDYGSDTDSSADGDSDRSLSIENELSVVKEQTNDTDRGTEVDDSKLHGKSTEATPDPDTSDYISLDDTAKESQNLDVPSTETIDTNNADIAYSYSTAMECPVAEEIKKLTVKKLHSEIDLLELQKYNLFMERQILKMKFRRLKKSSRTCPLKQLFTHAL